MPLEFTQNGAYYNAVMAQGESVVYNMAFTSDGTNPLNLTGFKLQLTIDFATPLYLNTDNGGIVITNATGGLANIVIADTDSINFDVGVFPYEFFAADSAGVRLKDFSGTWTINESFTPIL